jgi:hypothetical protein
VSITTNVLSSNLLSDLRQVCGFLWVFLFPPIKLTATVIGSYKSNYRTITTKTVPFFFKFYQSFLLKSERSNYLFFCIFRDIGESDVKHETLALKKT